ncbi:MAG: T9SS type A sorting domain-containing protein [Bacteroidia bacterium]|nr:T9SS type A sorting domain-containing protein [Bacteroidia bacterium]MBP7260239.1 T9SS type A sorting domain-containing protein [Bacteroidia bacterium]MBP9724485.1 T9SS type A sorting domain-containing protein [Bacteroidia bacterium]
MPDEQDPLSESDIELLACPNYRNGCRYGNVAKVGLDGNVIWFRTYGDNSLEILEVIQSADKQYIYVCGESRSYTTPYNHKTGNVFSNNQQINYGSVAPCNSSLPYRKRPYVAKIRYSDGELMWERVYGSNNNTGCFFELTGRATDLIQDGNGDLVVVGYEQYLNQTPTQEVKSFAMKIDASHGTSTEGDLVNFQFLTISANEIRSECYGIEYQYNQPSKFVICGRIDQSSGSSSIGFETYVTGIDNNLNLLGTINIIPPFTTTSSIPGHNLFEIIPTDIHLRGNGDILVGAVDDYIFEQTFYDQWGNVLGETYGASGIGEVLIFTNQANDYQYSTHVTLPHSIRAYDLKVGVIATENNGFAVVSSTQYPNSPPSGYTACCSPAYTLDADDCGYWNADAYILQYNSSNTLVWDKIFDAGLPNGNNCRPYDVKRQECMYRILVAPDGGLVVCGNNSMNFDDCYLAKLYGPCQNGATYPQNHSAYFNTVLTSSYQPLGPLPGDNYNYKGQILIGAGATVELTGVWHFADSRQVGVPTGIVVYPGGRLILNGATLSGIETSLQDCNFDYTGESMWDGIQVYGNRSQPQYYAGQPNPDHGVVIMQNGSSIQDARTAIAMGDDTYSSNGGVLRVMPSTPRCSFKNNFTSVAFLSYWNTADLNGICRSSFTDVDFICDAPMKDSYFGGRASNVFISNWAVYGIKFEGCKFENSYASNFSNGKRTTGIFSIDGTYSITPSDNPATFIQPCDYPDGAKCEFNYLSKGLEFWFDPQYALANSIHVYEAKFKDVSIGVESKIDFNTVLYKNQFEYTTNFKYDFNITQPRSILLNQTANCGVFDNTMSWNTNINTLYSPIGVQIDNSQVTPGATFNAIAGNTIANASGASYAIGSVFTHTNFDMQATCNTYTNMDIDWLVDFEPASPANEQFADQTISGYDPSNVFTASPGTANILAANLNGIPNYYTNATLVTSNTNILTPVGTTPCSSKDPCWAYGENWVGDEGGGEGDPTPGSMRGSNETAIMKQIYAGNFKLALTAIEALKNDSLKALYNLIYGVYYSGRSYAALTPLELSTLRGFAQWNNAVATYAQGILKFFAGDENMATPVVVPLPGSLNKNVGTGKLDAASGKYLSLYPNPASAEWILAYQLPSVAANYMLNVYDNMGRCVYTSAIHNNKGNIKIDCLKWANGIYLVSLTNRGVQLHAQKISILH